MLLKALVICLNIEQEIRNIKNTHKILEVSPIIHDPEQDAELCMIKTDEGMNIELISGKQVENILKKRISYYHLCYETKNIEFEIERLNKKGCFLVSDLKSAKLLSDKKVAFMQTSYGLIELVQE